MRTYLIDEISSSHMEDIIDFLKKNAIKSNLDQIFWVRLPEDLLSKTQFQHPSCKPHVFSVELGRDWIKLELFVRTLESMQCTCPGYCTPQQREFVINFADGMIERLGITT